MHWVRLITLFISLTAAVVSAAEPKDISVERAALLRKVESSSLKGWQKGSEQLDLKFRELNFRDAVSKLLTDKKLIENYQEAEPIAATLLQTSDPLSSLIAYEHLIDWVQAKNNPDLDGDFQKEMVQLLPASQPFPIEYSLLFERVYDHATDSNKGPGLKGNPALKFALSRFREPDVLQTLEHEQADKLFATLQPKEPSTDVFERARRDAWAAAEVTSARTREAQRPWNAKQKELSELSAEGLIPHFLRTSKVKGDGPDFIRTKFKDTAQAGRVDALASYDSLVRHLMENSRQDVFVANHTAVALFDEAPLSRYRSLWDAYLRAYEFASDARFGLGLSKSESAALALDIAKQPDGLRKLERFQAEWVLRLQRAKDKKSANRAAAEAAAEAGLGNSSLSDWKVSDQNKWAKDLPSEITHPKIAKEKATHITPEQTTGDPPPVKTDNSKLVQGAAFIAAAAGTAYALNRFTKRSPCDGKFAQLSSQFDKEPHRELDVDGFDRMAEDFDNTEIKTPKIVEPKQIQKHPDYDSFADLLEEHFPLLPLPKEFEKRE